MVYLLSVLIHVVKVVYVTVNPYTQVCCPGKFKNTNVNVLNLRSRRLLL